MFDARAFHAWLGSKYRFAHWFKDRVEQYGFEDGSDFYKIICKTGGRPRQDYLITANMAKELSMVEQTQMGRLTRRYFIQMEQAAIAPKSVQ